MALIELLPQFNRRLKISGVKLFALLLAHCFFSCAGMAPSTERTQDEIQAATQIETEPETAPYIPEAFTDAVPQTEPPAVEYLTIVAAGDNMAHAPILRACFQNGAYNFDAIYRYIKNYVAPADIAFINQESVVGNAALGYSGYPRFSAPPEMGAAVAAAGFTIVNHGGNHVMDRGEAGIISSMDFWDSIGIPYLGIFRSEVERSDRKVIVSVGSVTIGFLAYTYGTNGIPLPRNKPYLVSLIHREKMAADIAALRPLCDYLAVSMHWGEEFYPGVTAEQKRLAEFLADHQVDLVIGHHPHVLEPYARIARSDGGFTDVFYSLGNFLSAHADPVKEALLGGIMYVKLNITDGAITVEEVGLIPTISHYNGERLDFTVYPLGEYTEALAREHWKRKNDDETTVDYFLRNAEAMFGERLLLENPFSAAE